MNSETCEIFIETYRDGRRRATPFDADNETAHIYLRLQVSETHAFMYYSGSRTLKEVRLLHQKPICMREDGAFTVHGQIFRPNGHNYTEEIKQA